MMEKITASLAQIESELTTHGKGAGAKHVFMRNGDTPTQVTQVAYGVFALTDFCEMHVHPTMEEYFFFLKGAGIYTVDGQTIELKPDVFVRIPAGVPHRIEATSEEPLEYMYFGIATE